MNIINISSNIVPTPSQIAYCEELCVCGDDHHYIEEDSYYWLSKEIPIFLVNETDFGRYETPKGETERPSTEWLGYYTRSNYKPFSNTPIIVLCPERIAQCVANENEFMWLFAKVLIHELSHAKLDYRNENSTYGVRDDFFTWMEESTANYLTLEVFRNSTHRYHRIPHRTFHSNNFDEDAYKFVENFIKHQPNEYALGYWRFKDRNCNGWEIWRSHKSDLNNVKAKEKQAWIDYVSQNMRNLDKKTMKSLCDALGLF